MNRRLILVALLSLAVCTARADLFEYVKRQDDSFKWTLKEKTAAASGTVYTIELTSQTWQGIPWQHLMVVYVPDGVKVGDTIFLWNDGGRPDPLRSFMAFELSKRGQMPV